MNTSFLKAILENKTKISDEYLIELKNISEKYPYCQFTKILYTQGLKSKNDSLFQSAVNTASIYTKDRKVLYLLIQEEEDTNVLNSPRENQKETLKDKPPSPQQDKMTGEESSIPTVNKTTPIPKPQVQKSCDADSLLAKETGIISIDGIIPLNDENFSSPKASDTTSKMSFEEWLDSLERNPDTHQASESNILGLPEEAISSKVIQLDKKVFSENKNLAENRNVEKQELMTETLARIYIEQSKYEDAIEAYKILILKNPKKSSYFASKIKHIRDLKRNKT